MRADEAAVASARFNLTKTKIRAPIGGRTGSLLVRSAHAVCAPINSEGHGLETEVQVGPEHGLKHASYINCDQLIRIEKSRLTDFVGSLPASKIKTLNKSLRPAFDLE